MPKKKYIIVGIDVISGSDQQKNNVGTTNVVTSVMTSFMLQAIVHKTIQLYDWHWQQNNICVYKIISCIALSKFWLQV